jgi:hypothetical protein
VVMEEAGLLPFPSHGACLEQTFVPKTACTNQHLPKIGGAGIQIHRGSQGEPGGARGRQEEPGGPRWSQEEPWGTRRSRGSS